MRERVDKFAFFPGKGACCMGLGEVAAPFGFASEALVANGLWRQFAVIHGQKKKLLFLKNESSSKSP
jgi:hypothetical protein